MSHLKISCLAALLFASAVARSLLVVHFSIAANAWLADGLYVMDARGRKLLNFIAFHHISDCTLHLPVFLLHARGLMLRDK